MSKSDQMLNKYELFIFDWDGTLNNIRLPLRIKDSLKHLLRGNKRIKEYGYELSHDKDQMERVVKIKQEESRLLQAIADIVLMISRPKLHNGSLVLLKKLKARRKRIALFTNAGSYRLHRELRILRLKDYFEVIICAKQIKAEKPSPIGIEHILKQTGIKRSKTIVIGDSIDDIIAAKLANVASCGVAGGLDSYGRLHEMRPEYMFNSIEEIEHSIRPS